MRRFSLPAIVILLAAASPLLAAPPRWRLRAQVAVQSGVVRLGDLLLPARTAPSLSAGATILAPAPQPGSPMVWRRAQLALRLDSQGLAASDFMIPERVVITRRASAVARKYVMAALDAHFHRDLAAADVAFDAPLTSAPGDPGIVVESSRVDRVRGRIELRCRATRDPALLPFNVSLRVSPLELMAQRRAIAVSVAPAAPFLVRPGQTASLLVQGPSFAASADVMPLQAGRAGDRVRVLNLATHAVMLARVTGSNRLRTVAAPREVLHVGH